MDAPENACANATRCPVSKQTTPRPTSESRSKHDLRNEQRASNHHTDPHAMDTTARRQDGKTHRLRSFGHPSLCNQRPPQSGRGHRPFHGALPMLEGQTEVHPLLENAVELQLWQPTTPHTAHVITTYAAAAQCNNAPQMARMLHWRNQDARIASNQQDLCLQGHAVGRLLIERKILVHSQLQVRRTRQTINK